MKAVPTISFLVLASMSCAQSHSDWTLGGYLDAYFQYDFGRPASGDTVNGRGFDIAHNRLRLAVVEIDALLAPTAKRPFGVNVQLIAGKNADLINLAEPGAKNKYKWIRQAYVSYAGPKSGWVFDLGKFDTWIGYEGVDTRTSDQYSRSFNWTYSEPTYETGLRATGKLSQTLSLGLYLVQGWNEVESNGSPSLGAQLTVVVSPKTTVVVQNHFGNEGSNKPNDVGTFGGIGFPRAGVSRVHLFDAIITHQLSDKTKLAFNMDYGNASGGANAGKWNGEVLYLRHLVSDKQAASLRFERFEDVDGVRVGAPMILHSATLGYEWAVHRNGTLRLELRRDFANQSFFVDRNGTSNNRTTIIAAAIVKL